MHADPWLTRWLTQVRAQAAGAPILELGCGSGDDTAVLAAAGFEVVAVELDPEAAERARRRAPGARIFCQDLREPFPPAAAAFGVVVASLSLHYFAWDETVALVARIRAALRPGGLLLCRLNSTEDKHFGATGHPPLAPDYYLVDGAPKRFFDGAAVDRLFAHGWRVLGKEHLVTHKYRLPKTLWEVVLALEG